MVSLFIQNLHVHPQLLSELGNCRSITLSANLKYLVSQMHKLHPLDYLASKSNILQVDFAYKIIYFIFIHFIWVTNEAYAGVGGTVGNIEMN